MGPTLSAYLLSSWRDLTARSSQSEASLIPSSRITRFLLGTKYLRHFAKKLLKVYRTETEDGLVLYLRSNGEDAVTYEEIYNKKVYESRFNISDGWLVVDAGANSGLFSLRVSKLVGKTGTVIAFEPSSSSYSLLLKNIKANNVSNIVTFQLGLSSSPGKKNLILYDHSVDNSFYARDFGTRLVKRIGMEEVSVETLDSALQKAGIQRIDYLKIDVEGSELDVLKGAIKTLNVLHPRIVIETHNFGVLPEEVQEFLSQLDYKTVSQPHLKDTSLLHAW